MKRRVFNLLVATTLLLWTTSCWFGADVGRAGAYNTLSFTSVAGEISLYFRHGGFGAPPEWFAEFWNVAKSPWHEQFAWKSLGFHYDKKWATPNDDIYIYTAPYWVVVILCAFFPLRNRSKGRTAALLLQSSRCRKCGYDLRATPDRCPECGTAVECPREASSA